MSEKNILYYDIPKAIRFIQKQTHLPKFIIIKVLAANDRYMCKQGILKLSYQEYLDLDKYYKNLFK